MRNRILLTVLLLSLATPLVAQTGTCSAILVTAPNVEPPKGKDIAEFGATAVVDLELFVTFRPNVINKFEDGEHVVDFKVFTNRNGHYQTISVPFTADTKKKGQGQKVKGYPRPVPVQLLGDITTVSGKQRSVKASLPVAGTPIVMNSMFGEWHVEAYVDGEASPCATPAVFRIQP